MVSPIMGFVLNGCASRSRHFTRFAYRFAEASRVRAQHDSGDASTGHGRAEQPKHLPGDIWITSFIEIRTYRDEGRGY